MSDPAGSSNNPSLSRRGLRFLSTGVLVVGSALFGGLAVALWDRKSLAELRQPARPRPEGPLSSEDENGS
jgi:hypothetical protein